jgi:hypothetical protein
VRHAGRLNFDALTLAAEQIVWQFGKIFVLLPRKFTKKHHPKTSPKN